MKNSAKIRKTEGTYKRSAANYFINNELSP